MKGEGVWRAEEGEKGWGEGKKRATGGGERDGGGGV